MAVGKGEQTRRTILERAAALASRTSLEGVTIGRLADETRLSKSGLFAHFQSKESLQIEILRHTAQVFVDRVIRPALVVVLGQAPFASAVPFLVDVGDWIQAYPALAGIRAILLGVSLGAIGVSVRVLLGLDRPYME